MEQSPENPPQNSLGAGVSDEDLLEAILTSGYPLQSVAVDTILKVVSGASKEPREGDINYVPSVQEEWSYEDPDTNEIRHLDALLTVPINVAGADPYSFATLNPRSTIRHHLTILMECKQSELPFTFFVRNCPTGDFPMIVGLPHEQLGIAMDSDDSDDFLIGMSYFDALGFYDLDLAKYRTTAISMSRIYRKGGNKGKLELSGEEAFRAITYPLLKALKHYESLLSSIKVGTVGGYHDIHTVVPIAVLRAPMVAVHMEGAEPRMEAVPWVRLVRVDPGTNRFESFSKPVAVDVVHIDYLEPYVRRAYQSACTIAQRVSDFAIPVLTGTATTSAPNEPDQLRSEQPESDYPFEDMRPRISEEKFMTMWQEGMREMHKPRKVDDDG